MIKAKSMIFPQKHENVLEKINKTINYRKDYSHNKLALSRLKQKIFFETILQMIKTTQIELLMRISNKKNKKTSTYNIIKMVLQGLKNKLNSTYDYHQKSKDDIENEIDKNKLFLRNDIFGKRKHRYSKKKIATRNKQINKKLVEELYKMKNLNFKMKNELECLDIKLKLNSQIITSQKNKNKLFYVNLEDKDELSQIYNLLHDDLIFTRERFKLTVKNKENQNAEMIQLRNELNAWKEECILKNNIIHNEYITTSKVINEDSKENYTKTCQQTNGKLNNNKNCKYPDSNEALFYNNKLELINSAL